MVVVAIVGTRSYHKPPIEHLHDHRSIHRLPVERPCSTTYTHMCPCPVSSDELMLTTVEWENLINIPDRTVFIYWFHRKRNDGIYITYTQPTHRHRHSELMLAHLFFFLVFIFFIRLIAISGHNARSSEVCVTNTFIPQLQSSRESMLMNRIDDKRQLTRDHPKRIQWSGEIHIIIVQRFV